MTSPQQSPFLTHPICISLCLIHEYEPKPLIDILQHPKNRLVDKTASREKWLREIDTIYHPLFQFLYDYEIHSTCIVTGHFVDFIAHHKPETLSLLSDLYHSGLLYIASDAYWGSSHLSMYYLDWWLDEIVGTHTILEKYLKAQPTVVYAPHIYRGLALERVIETVGISEFLSVKNQKRPISYHSCLRDFRRFHGGKVTWISEEKNYDIALYYYPSVNFFHLMDIKTNKNPAPVLKTRSMEMGLRASEISSSVRSPSIQRKAPRIPEELSFQGYHVLQQSVLRQWQYGTFILGKEHAEVENIDDDPLMRNLFYIMNRDFLFYLQPAHYVKKRTIQFSSPYEAFVHNQNSIFQLEMLLNNHMW